jgi:hypothetical protein
MISEFGLDLIVPAAAGLLGVAVVGFITAPPSNI